MDVCGEKERCAVSNISDIRVDEGMFNSAFWSRLCCTFIETDEEDKTMPGYTLS